MSQGTATKLQPIAEPAQLDELLDWDVPPIAGKFPTEIVRVRVVDAPPRPMVPVE